MKTICFKEQNYEEIKRNYNSKNLFIDPIFQANNEALMYCDLLKNQFEYYDIIWKRPKVNFLLFNAL